MGGDNALQRVIGKWSLSEQLALISAVETATRLKILNPEIKIRYVETADAAKISNGFAFKNNKLKVYRNEGVSFEDVMPRLLQADIEKVKESLIEKSVSQISWMAVSEAIKTKSSDDIRHFWNSKILPLMVPHQNAWTEQEDLALLEFISDEDLRGQDHGVTLTQSQMSIPFEGLKEIIKTKSVDQCKQRWFVLLKGLGSYNPGQRIEPSLVAEKMKKMIETKSERYVSNFSKPAAKPESLVDLVSDSNLSRNEYINIVRYFQLKYKA